MLDLGEVKSFFSSSKVKKSLLIFLGVVLLMAVIVAVSVLTGCHTAHYAKVEEPALILTGKGKTGELTTAHFVVANPTDERKHFTIKCCILLDPEQCTEETVVVGPKSDKKVMITLATTSECSLEETELSSCPSR